MDLSIVIPTYKEKENLQELLPTLNQTLSGFEFEIIVVDDFSDDGTEEMINKLNLQSVQLLTRKNERGLSSAVHSGVVKAKGKVICFMDADFSHPPVALTGMYKMITKENYDLVVGSRLIKGGGSKDWPFVRKFISWGARQLAAPLTPIKDITSGFFMFKRDIYPTKELNLEGFKIGLEVAVKGNAKKFGEYPIMFEDRKYGESKLSGGVMASYLKQLAQLYKYKLFEKSK
ncbi:MAG: polyprenol monophosphomannose synthase, partial [Candidatus Margulisbacteria bacterium]|nr:polyprenol monophosphomannose synthase [Candidatus Margulisiibacteriota bacterium]